MGHIDSADRNQIKMVCLDDMVDKKSIVRIVDRFIDGLDLAALGFANTTANNLGRRSYNPVHMAKLYVFGYLKAIRSSRKLEEACHTNIEVMWLIGDLAPDFKTIADFRKDNLAALTALFGEFGSFAEYAGLIGKKVLATDGTKIRASNAKKRVITPKKLKAAICHHELSAADYLKALASADDQDQADALKKGVEHHMRQADGLKGQLGKLEAAGISGVALTDPDARNMGDKSSGVRPAYNVQTVVDAKDHIVTAFEVATTPDDHGHLFDLAAKSQEELRTKGFITVADKGYWGHSDLAACEQIGALVVVAPQGRPFEKSGGRWPSCRFHYDHTTDTYRCPENRLLHAHSKKDATVRVFYDKQVCACCTCASECLGGNTTYRTIRRFSYSDVLERAEIRYSNYRDVYALRQQTVEHVFGTVKRAMGADHFLLRTKEKVTTETALMFLGYNIKRAIGALGFVGTMEKLESYFSLLKEHEVALFASICTAFKVIIRSIWHMRQSDAA